MLKLKLKFRNNESYHDKRTAHCCTVTSHLLKPLKRRLIDVTSFKLSQSLYSLSVVFKRADNFGSVFTNSLDRRIYQTKFPTLKIFLLFVTVAMLPLYQSPVNCSSRNAEGNFTHKFLSVPFPAFSYVKHFFQHSIPMHIFIFNTCFALLYISSSGRTSYYLHKTICFSLCVVYVTLVVL